MQSFFGLKKADLLKFSILSLSFFIASQAAFADGFPNFYVGLEGQYHHYSVEKSLDTNGGVMTRGNGRPLFSDDNIGGGIFAGANLFELIGVELGFTKFRNSKTTDDLLYNMAAPGVSQIQVHSVNRFHAEHHNTYVDAMARFPVPMGLDVLASLGVGCLTSRIHNRTKAHAFVSVPPNSVNLKSRNYLSTRTSSMGFRVGLGTQIKFGCVGGRLMFRYQRGNDLLRNVLSAGLGIFFQF